jgi:hypothetical protein
LGVLSFYSKIFRPRQKNSCSSDFPDKNSEAGEQIIIIFFFMKMIKTLNSNTDPYKNWVISGASERLAVPASCITPVMLFIVNDMYIEYSGFHTNGFSQDTHICFGSFIIL